MKISLICFSLSGLAVMEKLKLFLEKEGAFVKTAAKSRYIPESLEISLTEWCKEQFEEADAIVFIGACGIAVRAIAPFVVSKKTDPAVLVIDELGKHVISLLSGHLGGANELAVRCGKILNGEPVITTATDLNGRFAVDVFAKNKGLSIRNMAGAKAVSAALLAGEPVGVYSAYPVEGTLPDGMYFCDRNGRPIASGLSKGEPLETGIAITIENDCQPFSRTAVLIPKTVYLGIGCRKGKEKKEIERAVSARLEECGLYRECLKGAASIDLKAEEEGILEFCREWNLPFSVYCAAQLLQAEGDFTPSSFVREVTGVDNVCERSAVLAGGSHIIAGKKGALGVTTAFAEEEWSVKF